MTTQNEVWEDANNEAFGLSFPTDGEENTAADTEQEEASKEVTEEHK